MASEGGDYGAFEFVTDDCWVAFDHTEGSVFVLEALDFDGWVSFEFHACFQVVVCREFEVERARVGFEPQFFDELFPVDFF